MHIVHVHVHVLPEAVNAFRDASIENARNSVQEPGVRRFDVVQQTEDRTRFVLIEVYRDKEAADDHKKTAHYHKWREGVAEMMAEPRFSVAFTNSFPGDEGW